MSTFPFDAVGRRGISTAIAFHIQNIGKVASRFSPWILVLPLGALVAIIYYPDSRWWQYTQKPFQEIFGPWVLGLAFVLSVAAWVMRGDYYHQWLILLTGSLLSREIDFQGASTAIYFAVALLLWHASTHITSMEPFVNHRLLVSLFVGAFITYFFTLTCDRDLWKFVPGFGIWRVNVEETLESLGHMLILAMVIASEVVLRVGHIELGEQSQTDPPKIDDIDVAREQENGEDAKKAA